MKSSTRRTGGDLYSASTLRKLRVNCGPKGHDLSEPFHTKAAKPLRISCVTRDAIAFGYGYAPLLTRRSAHENDDSGSWRGAGAVHGDERSSAILVE